MIIYFYGKREILVPRTGIKETQILEFFAWQTPPDVTRKILASSDPFQAYRDWVMETAKDVIEPIFIDHKTLHEEHPLVYSVAHVEDFDAWLKETTEQGYDIVVDAL